MSDSLNLNNAQATNNAQSQNNQNQDKTQNYNYSQTDNQTHNQTFNSNSTFTSSSDGFNFNNQPKNNSTSTQPSQKNTPASTKNNFNNSKTSLDLNQGLDKQPQQKSVNTKPKGKGTQIITWFFGLFVFLTILGMMGAVVYVAIQQGETTQIKTVETIKEIQDVKVVDEQSAVIDVAQKASPSVVSIVVTQELSNLERFFGDSFGNNGNSNLRRQVGAGTGFIASDEGYIITNRHVVDNSSADYTVVFSDGRQAEAEVLARDPILDIAIIKVDPADLDLAVLDFGDSDSIQVGQTTIAIGNSLGEFNNTVSKGIISGLGRTITASSGQGPTEVLEDIIQTDASINPGNSGGPLLDIQGNVIGVNVAKAEGGENIGFAIPINSVKPSLNSVIETGIIEKPFMGINYIELTPLIASENNLTVTEGALIAGTDGSPAVLAGSPADRAGLSDGDIILKIEDKEVDANNSLRAAIQSFSVGETVTLTVLRGEVELELELTFGVFLEE